MDKTMKRMATMHRMQVTGLEMFYKNGYYNTSVGDILNALSLSKGAFYYHFESKDDFFISIIQNLVVRKIYSSLIEPIEGQEDPLTVIVDTLDKNLATAAHNEFDQGFMLSNFMTEFNGRNPEIMKFLRDIYKVWEVNLVTILQKGKVDGYIARHVDSEGAASYLVASYIGIRTLMVEGNSDALRYQYVQQLRQYFKTLAQKQEA